MGTLILNADSEFARCKDTAEVQVGVFGAIQSNFDFEYDTCIAGPVDFSELAETSNDRIIEYQWSFGDSTFSMMTNPDHTYTRPGRFDVNLAVEDNRGCTADTTLVLPYFPIPGLVVAQPDRFLACTPGRITFNNLSSPINEEYTINWNFGDGSTGQGLIVDHVYEQAGTYSVDLEIISPIGCQTDASFFNFITIRQSPEAAFVFTPEELNDLNREVSFFNQTVGADGFQWDFGDGSAAFIENPIYEYPDTGVYDVVMVAFSDNGCSDSAFAVVDVTPFNSYFLPNAFTPDDDGVNDFFTGRGVTKGIRDFTMRIWNRWGEVVYETSDPLAAWNGRLDNDGEPSPKGVYHCQVNYVTARGEVRAVKSSITLLR